MCNAQEDKNSHFKLAQLWHTVCDTYPHSRKTYLHNRIINEIIKDDFDVNYKVTVVPDRNWVEKNHLKDCTALHFLFYDVKDIDTFNILLERGADFTIKNGNGQTVIHFILAEYITNNFESEIPFINAILSAHVKFQNFVNPHDDNGFSHLHGACIANNVEAAELFLNNGTSVDEVVSIDAPQFSGYTPLHFAAKFRCFEVAQILVKYKANINAKDTEGKSPLDLLFEDEINHYSLAKKLTEKQQILKLLLDNNGISTDGIPNFHLNFALKDLTSAEKLLNQNIDIDDTVRIKSAVCYKNTALHFAAENSIEAVKMLLIHGAKIDITNDKGQTPFDICVDKYSLKDVCDILSCVNNFEKVLLSDGETKLLDVIAATENLHKFTLFLSDNIKDVTAVVPIDSLLFPGYSILHLAVILSKKIGYDRSFEIQYDKTIIQECLNRNLSINVQDVRGQTPIHLAFNKSKIEIVNLLLEHLNQFDQVIDLVDEDNLSYLHIACAFQNEALVERLLETSDPNIVYNGKIKSDFIEAGLTPLHVTVQKRTHIIAELLLRHGADLHKKDSNGWTPIHWLITEFYFHESPIADVLLNSLLTNPVNLVINDVGFSYLHVTCNFGNVEVVKMLLDLGSNVNEIIKYDKHLDNQISNKIVTYVKEYHNYTPLKFASHIGWELTEELKVELLDLLLSRGANLLTMESNILRTNFCWMCPDLETINRSLFQALWNHEDSQKYVEDKLGMTKLHIACSIKNKQAVKNLLNDGADPNLQIHSNSPIFAGWTAMHFLLANYGYEELVDVDFQDLTIGGIINLLLEHGADVTIANTDEDTPIHVFYLSRRQRGFNNIDRCHELLSNAQKNFSINPVNAEGISYFHLSCLWQQIEVVEKFLQHGSVDINRPIDYFAKHDAGCTPLHFTLNSFLQPDDDWSKLLQMVDLLLKHGADVSAVDVHGNTPLHQRDVLNSPDLSILKKLVSYGGDITKKNIKGQNPIEAWPNVQGYVVLPSESVKTFKKFNRKINSWNDVTGEGNIAKIFISPYGYSDEEHLAEKSEFDEFIKSSDAKVVDDLGRTAIHNSVALNVSYSRTAEISSYVIGRFIEIGIDIDHQDKLGQTALHYAVQMENPHGALALLAFGADINIVDNNGKSAFFYAVELSENKNNLCSLLNEDVTVILRLHILKLKHLGVEVSELNQNLVKRVQRLFENRINRSIEMEFIDLSQKFFSQVEMTKIMDVGMDSLTLFHFLSETAAVNLYCLMPKFKRDMVDDFFQSIDLEPKFKGDIIDDSSKYIDINELNEVAGIIKLQFKKMTARLELIDLALSSLRTLLGFSVPGLCEQISRFLLNSDLENLIKSTILETGDTSL